MILQSMLGQTVHRQFRDQAEFARSSSLPDTHSSESGPRVGQEARCDSGRLLLFLGLFLGLCFGVGFAGLFFQFFQEGS